MSTLSFPISLMLRGFGPQVNLNTSEVTGTLGAVNGGTGVANNAAATLTRSGNHALTITTTGTTGLTFPTTGTLATLAGSEALSGKTYEGNTITTGTGTLTIAATKTLTANNTLTLSATDGSTLAIGTGGTLGTAAYTASTAYDVAGAAAAVTPTTLGLVIGTNTQAYNSNLTAINQALTTSSSPTFAALSLTAQPAFSATGGGGADVTGDGTAYSIVFATEIYDQGTNYDVSTGIFTAPTTGKYLFSTNVVLSQLGVAHNIQAVTLVTSNRSYVVYQITYTAGANPVTEAYIGGSILADMDASDTAYISVTVTGGTKVVDVVGSGGYRNWFTGIKVA